MAKTHTGTQPEKTILPGVFGNVGSKGKIRASALKRFGRLQGGLDAYEASPLAKAIDAAPDEEKQPLLRKLSAARSTNQMFETFHGDVVSKAKLEQHAKGLEVHPESADECTQMFMDSTVTAGLGELSGDSISLVAAATIPTAPETAKDEESEDNGGPAKRKILPRPETTVLKPAQRQRNSAGANGPSSSSTNQAWLL